MDITIITVTDMAMDSDLVSVEGTIMDLISVWWRTSRKTSWRSQRRTWSQSLIGLSFYFQYFYLGQYLCKIGVIVKTLSILLIYDYQEHYISQKEQKIQIKVQSNQTLLKGRNDQKRVIFVHLKFIISFCKIKKARLLLAYTGMAWEDVQQKQPQQSFGKDKQSLGLEFPNLPYLIDGDLKITETRAICQYIIERAKKSQELLGKDIKERVRILMVIEVINDVLEKINQIIYDQTVNKKRESIFKDFVSPKLKQIVNFKGNRQFLFDRLTLADFVLAELSYYVQSVFPSEYKNLQFLHEVRTKFMAVPEIKSYYAKEQEVKGPFTNIQKATIKF